MFLSCTQLIDGTLRGRWNLGDGEIVAHLNGTRLDDGQWHVVQFTRQDNYVVIKVDGGGGVKQYESRESRYLTMDVDPSSLVVGAFVEFNTGVSQDFEGMLKWIRKDCHKGVNMKMLMGSGARQIYYNTEI